MHWVLAATLICGASVMTSCKEARTQEDNAVKEVQSTELIRTSQSWDGVELPDYLQGRPELVAVKYVFPAGKKLGWHHHPVMNYGILVQGELTIIGQDGKEKVVCPWQFSIPRFPSNKRRTVIPDRSSFCPLD